MKHELIGHSGCELNLVTMNNEIVVEKKAKCIEYNERLKAQCKKQEKYTCRDFSVVKVLRSGYGEDGLFYFDMEYISGITLAEYMRKISLNDLDKIADILLSDNLETFAYDKNANEIFQRKIKELKYKLDMKELLIQKAIILLENYGWDYVIMTKCHGDFTLENIIVSRNGLFLIDFLDSFYNSWMIDFAKLLQDVELHWHYRKEDMDVNLALRLLILKENMMSRLMELHEGKYLVDTIYHILLLNILRIFPYTKDQFTYDYLIDKIKYVQNIIENNSWQ